MVEKKIAKDPVALRQRGDRRAWPGQESANNADAQCKFIPMLTLGIPASAVMALMLGALTIQGIAPGPQVMTQKPDLFWGLVASMWIGNLMLVVLNLPMVGMWVQLLKVPYRLLFPAIMAFSCIGIYSVNNSAMEIYLTALFGIIGFFWMKADCPPAPMLLGFVLGPLMEEKPASRALDFPRRPVGVRHPADQPRVRDRHGADPDRHGPPAIRAKRAAITDVAT
jgi:TctA family transporter